MGRRLRFGEECVMRSPSFEELAELIRASARLKRDERIDPDTQFLRNLSIAGRHGVDLLKAIERHYGIEFSTEIHDRVQSDRVGGSEDPDESSVVQTLFGNSTQTDKSFTVGQLYRAMLLELSQLPEIQKPRG